MALKFVLLCVLIAGYNALPTPDVEPDMSMFFEHVDTSARIVGGTQAAAGSHPHMGALSQGALVRNFLCGSSIISPRTVLTAAHCINAAFSGSLSSSLRVTVGTNRWNSGGQTYAFARNVTHPNYVVATIRNDIGVLITTTNIVMSALVRPITLSYDWVGAGVNVRVAGWGRIRQNGALSATLLELNKVTIDGNRCITEVAQGAIIHNFRDVPTVEPHIEICTFHSANHGTCNGDSGSALARTDNGQQVGIVSWGLPCARGVPDMFVRVSAFRSWLQNSIVW